MTTNKIVVHHKVEAALDFFERLGAYSAEYVRRVIAQIHRHWPTRNHYDAWRGEGPLGHVLHYTAGTSYAGTIRHFVLGHRASSHWVVAKALDRRFDELRAELGLTRQLQAECCQLVPPTRPAWHAGWVNRFLAGTECRNAGVLRPHPKAKGKPHGRSMSRDAFFAFADWDVDDLDFYWWPDGWTTPFKGEVLHVNGSWWESWSRGTLATVIEVLRHFVSLYPETVDPAYFLAHHNTSARKNDVVLPVDLDLLRNAILFSEEHVDDIEWLAAYDDVEDGFEDLDDPWMLRELEETQGDRGDEDDTDFDPGFIDGFVDAPREGREALRRLGYLVADERTQEVSARVYQRSRDLAVDGDVGPITMGRLTRDLKDWRIGR